MLGASWRLARTMLDEVVSKMSPRWTKIAQAGPKKKKPPAATSGSYIVLIDLMQLYLKRGFLFKMSLKWFYTYHAFVIQSYSGITYDHHAWSSYMIIIYNHICGRIAVWYYYISSSQMIIMHDHHIWSSDMVIMYKDHVYVMIIYADHMWWSCSIISERRGNGRNLFVVVGDPQCS